jgi:Xaa-Pro dipeptidase
VVESRSDAPTPTQEVPRFSLAERDRRWGNVRRLMARDGVDAIVAPGNSGAWEHLNANARYLVGVGGNCSPVAAVFPLDGEVTAVVSSVPGSVFWHGAQDWVTDVRDPAGFYALYDAVARRLQELPAAARRGRVGIAGLADLPRFPEGSVAHGAYEALRRALPDAELVNATPLLDEARFVKSAEEIRFLQEAVRIVEEAIDVLAREARPGMPERVVYARVLARMIEEGSEIPTFFSWQAGWPQRQLNHFQPTGRRLRAGDMISTEIEASVIGYRGQVTQPFVLGTVSERYGEMMRIHGEALERCYAALVPGATPAALADIAREVSDDPYTCRIVIHGRGLGDDAPLLVFRSQAGTRHERMSEWRLAQDAVLMVKPYVFLGDPHRDFVEESVGWGDTVVVTAGGARRLGTKPPRIIEIA